MPTGKNWFNLIWVTLGFMAYTVCVYYLSSIKEIKDKIMAKQVQIKRNEIPEGWSTEAADFINRVKFY